MALFGIRFDLRNPAIAGTTMTARYAAMLDMVQWADERGFVTVIISEHHGAPDGYLPSALPMAAAIAARTSRVRINISAVVASFHDPLRLAEDVVVVDHLSGGRLDIVLANGYVPSEFAMFGRDPRDRPKQIVETVETLRRAWTGAPFEFRGRRAQVTPAPCQPGGPAITLGGSSEVTARRAARLGDGYLPSSPELWDFYRDEAVRLGKPDPGPWLGGDTSFVHVADDPDAAWESIAPFALHEVNAYGEWMASAGIGAEGGYAPVTDVASLRSTGQYRCLTPGEFAAEVAAKGEFGFTLLHPMMGGIPPALAWESLHAIETAVPSLQRR